MHYPPTIAILGGGNIGLALAEGFTASGAVPPSSIWITRRKIEYLRRAGLDERGFKISSDNSAAIAAAELVVFAVRPEQLEGLVADVRSAFDPARQLVVSVITGVTIAELHSKLGDALPIVRAMPNTAVAICESMTCLAREPDLDPELLTLVERLFRAVGEVVFIDEEQMTPATALCACGMAFFLRAIRAASQGGIEIGFHPEEALRMAGQTAKGAASLLGMNRQHPEMEIDKVTTPRGCTIYGLNEMEHQGFSSAMIKGIILAAQKAAALYKHEER